MGTITVFIYIEHLIPVVIKPQRIYNKSNFNRRNQRKTQAWFWCQNDSVTTTELQQGYNKATTKVHQD